MQIFSKTNAGSVLSFASCSKNHFCSVNSIPKMKIFISAVSRASICKFTRRFSSIPNLSGQQQNQPSVDKNLLMKLRRKTGYSFVNCKKALLEFGEDLEGAEKWLHELARKEGWDKAMKFKSRTATQGLIGVLANGKVGTVVEVNCETDFVAKNEKFRSLVQQIAETSLSFGEDKLSSTETEPWQKFPIGTSELLKQSAVSSSETLADRLTLTLSQVGEKLQLCRAICLGTTDPNTSVFGYVHPRQETTSDSQVLMGQFGALVAFYRDPNMLSRFPSEELGKQLCQHIVGMAPEKLGKMPSIEELSSDDSDDETEEGATGKDAATETEGITDEIEQKETESAEQGVTSLSDETELLRQDFLHHPDISVGEYVYGHGAKILEFVRFQCGETASQD